MSDEIIVQAEVITDEPANELVVQQFKVPVIVDNVAELDKWVDAQIAPFIGAQIDPSDSEQVSQARKLCAMLNKIAEPIDKKRIAVKKEYQKPINAFDDRVRAVVQKIKDARADLNDQVKEADAMFKANRLDYLREEYAAIAGDLVNVIPLEALLENDWLQRSKSEQYGFNKLSEKASKAMKGYRNLEAQNFTHKQEVLKCYCETLDMNQAMAVEVELVERDREMEAFQQAQIEAGLKDQPIGPTVPQIIEADIPEQGLDYYNFTIKFPSLTIQQASFIKAWLLDLGVQFNMTKSVNPVEVNHVN